MCLTQGDPYHRQAQLGIAPRDMNQICIPLQAVARWAPTLTEPAQVMREGWVIADISKDVEGQVSVAGAGVAAFPELAANQLARMGQQ